MKCADCGKQITYRDFPELRGPHARDKVELRACTCKEHGSARRCTGCCDSQLPGADELEWLDAYKPKRGRPA